jgi:hypothetical protein
MIALRSTKEKTKMSVSEIKSNLARLMAEENLIVEQRKIETAFFDSEARLLAIPTFKETVSVNVTDLMISHECAHALYTPHEGWRDCIEFEGIRKSIINVVEDARIERKIKYKYPGLRSIYFAAYKELLEMNFFGLDGKNLSNLNLIDKINLHFKVGFMVGLYFNDAEQEFVDKIEKIETFDEAVEISREIQKYMKENTMNQFQEFLPFDEDEEDEDGESVDIEKSDKNDSGENDVDDDIDDIDDGDGIDEIEEEYECGETGDELDSLTDKAAKEAMSIILSEDNKESFYVDLNDDVYKNYIVDHTTIYSRLSSASFGNFEPTAFNKFKEENNSVVSFLVKEFLLKKNAMGRRKIKVSKTGDVNLSKLYQYKITDDIFKRSTSVPNDQSHGLVFFLDWSGSMSLYIKDTMNQLISMLLFCRKLNIPYEVYAFTSAYYDYDKHKYVNFSSLTSMRFPEKTSIIEPLKLMNLFSSRMNNLQFANACNYMLCTAENLDYNNRYYCIVPKWLVLNSTPLNHAILISEPIMKEFKERTKVQVINSIYLTDGESHSVFFQYKKGLHILNDVISSPTKNVYLRNKKTKATQLINETSDTTAKDETNSCIKFIKQYSNFRMFGFRLISTNAFKKNFNLDSNFKDKSKFQEYYTKLSTENHFKVDGSAYDEFYYIRPIKTKNEDLINEIKEKDSVSSITSKFTKTMSNRVNNKIFLKKFIEFIS